MAKNNLCIFSVLNLHKIHLRLFLTLQKSAWLRTTPLELILIKISVTVSISRSDDNSIRPICLCIIFLRLSILSYINSGSTSGLFLQY